MAPRLTTSSLPRLLRKQQQQQQQHYSRTLATAADAAQQLLHAFQGQVQTARQTLDGHQLQKLSLTLHRPHLHPGLDITSAPPRRGTPLPPGYHLAYFSPAATEADLGPDGTDRTFNAPAPFTRRMWAGGSMRWAAAAGGAAAVPPLRVGDDVEERTRLVAATAKRSRRDGAEMVLVEVEKEFWGPGAPAPAVVDRRSWVFRPPATAAGEGLARVEERVVGCVLGEAVGKASRVEDVAVDASAFPQRQLHWSPVALFRFSALTFNAHMIHYNESWTRNIEGHPGVVVHGPLNLIAMMDYWRDVHGMGKEAREISYRALSPLYAGDQYAIRTESVEANTWEIEAVKGNKLCMRGTISSHA